jgi:glycosyltransferase involved in cell wall biosynthesis
MSAHQAKTMRLGIDASNIRTGGGITHIAELLRAAQPQEHGISRVTVWASRQTLRQLTWQPWLDLVHEPLLDQSLPVRLYWQRTKLTRLAQQACDCLFVPGGSYGGSFKPFVTMSQNMLPFERREWQRYGFSAMSAKMCLLRLSQSRSLRQASGVVFLTEYARSEITKATGLKGSQRVVPHGIHPRFFLPPRQQKPISQYSAGNPFRLLYVSKIEPYKHQWRVVKAVARLRQQGLPISLSLVGGPECPASTQKLKETISRVDPHGQFIFHAGDVPHAEVPACYHSADAFVFASSCENLPNIMLEAMAAGLPIACSNLGPMPEVLGPAGVYFDPEHPAEIAAAIQLLVEDRALRQYFAESAYAQAKKYSWERCASETFSYLVATASLQTHSYREALEPLDSCGTRA